MTYLFGPAGGYIRGPIHPDLECGMERSDCSSQDLIWFRGDGGLWRRCDGVLAQQITKSRMWVDTFSAVWFLENPLGPLGFNSPNIAQRHALP